MIKAPTEYQRDLCCSGTWYCWVEGCCSACWLISFTFWIKPHAHFTLFVWILRNFSISLVHFWVLGLPLLLVQLQDQLQPPVLQEHPPFWEEQTFICNLFYLLHRKVLSNSEVISSEQVSLQILTKIISLGLTSSRKLTTRTGRGACGTHIIIIDNADAEISALTLCL